ncbi:MAG: polysaccharide biosynthesis tyrosine autokinase [Flavobacterium sp.]|nr:MAG: polysaccharide biosynthesis tyrosine autokinase [Flavobacterium sp.]
MSGEGKSFVALNLGHIISLSGKKVLLMELDLRKPGLSVKLNLGVGTGYTDYIIDNKTDIDSLIRPLAINDNLFLMGSGPLPPNPPETLMSSRTTDLISELRERFDYIIIDAPPIGIVTDAQLLADHVDMCLYLVRQKYTTKDQLSIVQDLYVSKKMKKIAIVVNDIKASKGYGYGYGYGAYGS